MDAYSCWPLTRDFGSNPLKNTSIPLCISSLMKAWIFWFKFGISWLDYDGWDIEISLELEKDTLELTSDVCVCFVAF